MLCAACAPEAVNFDLDQRFLWMRVFSLKPHHGCETGETSLASARYAWLMLQAMLGKKVCPPMPDDPQPEFWPIPPKREYSGPSLIERIKAAYRLEDIAGEHTSLHGTSVLKGKCFLHGERNGEAFTIWVDEQKWKCFGVCGTGGDIVDLVRAMKERGIPWMKS